MPGTNLWGVLFFFGTVIGLVLLGWFLYTLWRNFADKVQVAKEKGQSLPNIVFPIIATLVVVGACVCIDTLAWNTLQGVTTNMSRYQSPAEAVEQKAVESATMPSAEELDQARIVQKERAEVNPHQRALDDFDAVMQKEADKIRARSLNTTQPSTAQ